MNRVQKNSKADTKPKIGQITGNKPINIRHEFIDLVLQQYPDNNIWNSEAIKELIFWLLDQGWIDDFRAKKAVIKYYYTHQLKVNQGKVGESVLDAAIAFDVTEHYVKQIIYKCNDIK